LAREAAPDSMVILGVVQDELERLVADVRQRGEAGQVLGRLLNDESLAQEVADAKILMHCSPIGMHPDEDRSLVPRSMLRKDLCVFDAVYNPRRTKLLQDAEAVGCKTIEGLEMFLGQAYVQFELWTGQSAPRTVMRQVVEANL
jgi:shikimate dehydrogenase